MLLFNGTSFAHKMAAMALASSAIASATLMASFLGYDSMSSKQQMRIHLLTLARIVGQNSTAALLFDDRPAAREMLEALQTESSVVTGCLYSSSGVLFARYQRQPNLHLCAERVGAVAASPRGYVGVTRDLERSGEFIGTIYIESDLVEVRNQSIHLCFMATGLFLVALILSMLFGSVLQRRILRPFTALATAMRTVSAEHDFRVRVSVFGRDEIAQLGYGFNTMLEELEKRAQEKAAFEARLEYQAFNDELTGFPNRRLMADRLNQALAAAARDLEFVALLYIDLDGFKLVNDSLGHSIGDMLLAQVANRFSTRVRESDTLARLGGDEFAVILRRTRSKEQPGRIGAELLESLAQPFFIEGHEIRIGASVGISFFPEHGTSTLQLLQNADSAMYAAKRGGKNRIAFFSEELGTSARERLYLEHELRHALEHGGITLAYQPEFDLSTFNIVRFEALARWKHPTLGRIPPAKFIPIAEETGLIVELGAYIMELACNEATRWQKVSKHPIQVAVNVSNIQFSRESFVDEVTETLLITGLDPHLLQIELTESVMVDDPELVTRAMNQLAELGVGMAVDDFGTGYSSLSYLPSLPFCALKIDRSFISELEHRPDLKSMIHSLVMLAHNFGLKVIAEGVETQAQLEVIKQLGGNEVQGYLLGKPTADPLALIEDHPERLLKEKVPT